MTKSTPLEIHSRRVVSIRESKFLTGSKIFFILATSFLGGVFAASFFRVENYLLLILVAVALAMFVRNYKNRKTVVAGAAVLFLALGVWRSNVSLDTAKNNLAGQNLGPVEFVGIVASEPEIGEKNQKIIVSMNFEEYTRKPVCGFTLIGDVKKKVLINTPLYSKYAYGDELKINCIIEAPKNREDSRFDYQMYLAKDGIYRICNKAQITTISRNKGNRVYLTILAMKNKFEEKLSQVFPDPEGAYLKGLLLGGSKRMPRGLADAFSRTGTSHTVAVSGYNVTIVVAFLMWLGIYLGLWRQQVFSFAIIGIVFFILMTGAPSSAVRAGIMGGLVIWAMKEGRLANSTDALIFAASMMLAINPLLF